MARSIAPHAALFAYPPAIPSPRVRARAGGYPPARQSGRADAAGGPPPPAVMTDLLDKRLIFVAGKGGVGKSTVAAALGMLAARPRRPTIVAEVAHQDHVAR